MTVYEDYEYSSHDGSPVEVYKLTGTFQNYYYTNAQQEITVDGQAYAPALITRNEISIGTQEDSNLDLELELPFDLQLVIDYAFAVSPPDLTLEIRRYHHGSNPATDWIVAWKGRITSFSTSGHVVKALVPSAFSVVMQGEIPSVAYQNPCNHRLYDDRCKLTASSYQQDTTIVSVVNTTITVVDDGFADGYLQAGEIINTTKSERRLIVANVANVLSVNFPFYNAEAGDSVSLFAGCNHSFTACKDKFTNSLNYGGFPFVPAENPFESEL